MRARGALKFPPPVATNLGFVYIDEDSIRTVWNGSLGYSFGLLWPRQVYARLVQALDDQGAKAVAFDIVFAELRPDHNPVQLMNGGFTNSDDFFALHMQRASNVVLAVTKDVSPPDLFLTNAALLGHIWTTNDSDGILRRAQAFLKFRRWHKAFRDAEAKPEYGVDLSLAEVESSQIVLPRRDGTEIKVPLDQDGNFDVADFWGDKLPPGMARKTK